MDWLLSNISYLTVTGSQSYAMNTRLSDLDMKGVCVPPKEVREHLFQKFEQAINNKDLEQRYSHLRNPLNPKIESTVYSLSKFFQLAAAVNPNIIEMLYTDEKDILEICAIGCELRDNRDIFLSSRAKFSFQGYAFSQFHKIQRHRKWIVKGEIEKPDRKNYGLPESIIPGFGEIERFIKREVERWNLSKFEFDDLSRNELKETIWELVARLNARSVVNWDNWPQKYEEIGFDKLIESLNLNSDISRIINQELKFQTDLKEYSSWLKWKKERNPERKALEEKAGFDTKHSSQLVRLARMSVEILSGQGVIVKRPDAKELLEIKNGGWSYDKLVEEHQRLDKLAEELYKTTKLPKSVNYEKINSFYIRLLEL
jgi:hypothetical protein